VPYVKCPSCQRVGYPVAYLSLELCSHCGDALPARRHVVSIVRRPGLGRARPARHGAGPGRPPAEASAQGDAS
jgi:hypothetical protein